jgi:DNA-binding SARP family transcriptional activator
VSSLRIKLFGSLEVECDGQPLPRFPSRKVRDLFAYLVLHRQGSHAREHLAGLFWGDSDDERARHSLNTALWRLNGVLTSTLGRCGRGQLRVTPQEIGFNATSDFWLDVAEFETRCSLAAAASSVEQQTALYRQAITFYSGDLLVDCYEEWAVLERERLQCLYLKALTRVLAVHAERQEFEMAIDCARRILACDSLREDVHRDLIELYLAAGQASAARRQYRVCEELLQRELGIAPMPETQRLLARILDVSGTQLPPLTFELAEHARGSTASLLADLTRELADARALLRDLAAACDQAHARLLRAADAFPQLLAQNTPDPRIGLSRPTAVAHSVGAHRQSVWGRS